jgi:hypothetical protein
MKEIALTQGQIALVDDADYERVNQFKWSAMRTVQRNGRVVFYAQRVRWLNTKEKKQEKIFLHRFILGAPKGMVVDHKNRQTLDCQRENLRLATGSQNHMNSASRNSSGGYKGVYFDRWGKKRRRFVASISVARKTVYIGRFESAEAAARAYDAEAMILFGEFARLNFPELDSI